MADFYSISPVAAPIKGGAEEVGNKAWNLMRLAQAGMPVPPAFVLPTAWCHRAKSTLSPQLDKVLADGIAQLESATRLGFGAAYRPLLVSVRSGAAVSMPGMMETLLDVGLNAVTVDALIRLTGNPRLAWDSYRRLVQGYAEIVAHLPTAPFDQLVAAELQRAETDNEDELDHRQLRALTQAMLGCYSALTGSSFPVDPYEQLRTATVAIFSSWDAPKAVSYRRLNNLSDAAGTAVTVQTMVYGNAGGESGAGVAFTRNPATGTREMYFDFQFNAQGEDVVSGRQHLRDNERLQRVLPAVWLRLNDICRKLEVLFGDVQDFEFTIQAGELFLLQTRRAKRTDWAALTIAVDMVEEGLLTPVDAIARLKGIVLASIVRTSFALPIPQNLAVAQVAGMGVASGAIALDSEAAKRLAAPGRPVIFVRRQTVTTDIEGMALADGILTGSGGRTSHAAVVARQLGKVCLVACPTLEIDLEHRQCHIGGQLLREGDLLSLDGNTGAVYPGRIVALSEHPAAALATIARWNKATSGEFDVRAHTANVTVPVLPQGPNALTPEFP
ncbi:MAG TPA: PEP/pyruvate-binding domain-containing protein [Steroidobacteraceae bacterium]